MDTTLHSALNIEAAPKDLYLKAILKYLERHSSGFILSPTSKDTVRHMVMSLTQQ